MKQGGKFLVLPAGLLAAVLVGWSVWLVISAGRLDFPAVVISSGGMGILVLAVQLADPGRERFFPWWPAGRKAISWLFSGFLLGLLAVCMGYFHIESPAFYNTILAFAYGGYWLHLLVPPASRITFFVILSLVAFAVIWGSSVVWLLLIGLVLISLGYLPFRFGVKLGLLIAAGLILGLARGGDWPLPDSLVRIWPVLGGIFMFRPLIFVYQTRKHRPGQLAHTFAYFFLFPNIVFPLFPVIDFNTFIKSYIVNAYDPEQIQRGLRWLLRGFLQILLYRVVDTYFYVPPSAVVGTDDLWRFVITNYLLYLHFSGLFHLIVGLLLLFGFNLPPTSFRYYLATSINDFWRRINIYWRDFMVNLFFYPTYSRLRGRKNWLRLILGLLTVLFFTWFFHAYQWFWIRGEWRFWVQDVVFWSILGILMIVTSLVELRQQRRTFMPGSQPASIRALFVSSGRATVLFIFMALLWSYWTTADTAQWLELWQEAIFTANWRWLLVIPIVYGALFFGELAADLGERVMAKGGMLVITLGILCLTLLTFPAVQQLLGQEVTAIVAQLQSPPEYTIEFIISERGYYETLLNSN